MSPTAFAADAEAASAELAEVIVTARRVEENLQRVPIAVTAYTPERLQEMGVRDFVALNFTIPAVDACCNVFNLGLVYVRGLQGSPTYFADAPVGPTGYGNFFDISSAQVLKGPQGTLFGQASVAGAFVYEPRKPGRVLGGSLSASAGSYGRRTFEGAIDAPLIPERLFLRVAAVSNYRDGYIHDLSTNRHYGDMDYYIVRPSITWQITERLENYTLFQYSHNEDGGYQNLWLLEDINFNRNQPTGAPIARNGGSADAYYALAEQMLLLQRSLGNYTIAGTNSGCADAFGSPILGTRNVTSLGNFTSNACGRSENIDALVVNHTTYEFNDSWSVKNIFAFNKSRNFTSQNDGDLTPLLLFQQGSPLNRRPIDGPRRVSDELQLHGEVGRFKVTAGLFGSRVTTEPGIVYAENAALTVTATDTRSLTEARAVYASTDVGLTDRLTLTAGARYNKEHLEQTSFSYNPVTLAVIANPVNASRPDGNVDSSNTSYTLGVQYQLTPATMLFLTNAKGFSGAGFQGGAGVGLGKFDPQTLNNFEGGVKSTFRLADVTTRVNASVYYGLFDNIQVQIWSAFNNILGQPSVGFLTSNAAKAHIKGVDLDLTVVPSRYFEFGLGVAYSDNKYTEWLGNVPGSNPPQTFDYSNTKFVQTPDWKGNVTAMAHLPIRGGELGRLDVSATYSARTKLVYIALPTEPTNPANPTTGLICTRDRTVANGYPASLADGRRAWVHCVAPQDNLDLSLSWREVMGSDRVGLSFIMTNVLGNEVVSSAVILDGSAGMSARQSAVPRMYYATLNYRF